MEHDFFVTIPTDNGYEECLAAIPRCKYSVYQHGGITKRLLWENSGLLELVHKYQPHVIFNMANRGFGNPLAPQATLVQDAHLFYPYSHFGTLSLRDLFTFWYHRRHFRIALKRTKTVFCQTEVARMRLRSLYKGNYKICLCPNQVSDFASKGLAQNNPPALKHLSGKFKLFVLCRYYSHKNLEVIPKMVEHAATELKDVAFITTVSPDHGASARSFLKKVNSPEFKGVITNVGPIPQEQLASYYYNTNALFLPTLLESFSGTYMEAMFYKRPILTSDMDFARAVCGDAALYFNPFNPEDIIRTILRLKRDHALRDSLVANGQSRMLQTGQTWDSIARSVISELKLLSLDQTEVLS